MARSLNTCVARQGPNIPANDAVASCLATREVTLSGPCVVSGVQSRHAEELVFVQSGTVEICDGNGNVLDGQDSCISIPQGQRYHLHVNGGETIRLLILMVPSAHDCRQFSVLQTAKDTFRDMILDEQRC
ncbi:hypothetical protein [Thalassospira sp.]|uniref:hypothetical protein n=1 Tax=Thalassospira sp. TaxID=1912094 RepID=UPI003AA9CEBF